MPVTFPPGRARLATIPVAIGSLVLTMTIGMVFVACLTCENGSRAAQVKTASTFSWTKSFASSAERLWFPSAYRTSIRMFFPST